MLYLNKKPKIQKKTKNYPIILKFLIAFNNFEKKNIVNLKRFIIIILLYLKNINLKNRLKY